jgi:signal transduction histidine kinase
MKYEDDRVCQLLKGEGLMSRMMCPLEVEGKRIGMLGLSSRRQYAFGFHQIRIFEVFGPRFAQAVQKVHQIEQLQAANSSYLEALGFISHELKSPLASMVMEARLLQQGYVGELSVEQQQRIAKIANKAQYMIGLIRDYLDLARLETGELQAEPLAEVDLRKDVVDPAVELANAYLERFKVTLDNGCPADMPAVMCDPRLLVVALSNLLSNAAKYGREGGKARIIVENSGEGFSINVWNEGEGFSDEQRQQLFQKFSRLHSPGGQQRKGTGVGLYSVRRIAQLHGGTASASSEPGQWAQFTIFIPQPLICSLPG